MVALFLVAILLSWSPSALGAPSLVASLGRAKEVSFEVASSSLNGSGPVLKAESQDDDRELGDPCEDVEDQVESGIHEERNHSVLNFFALSDPYCDVTAQELTGRFRYRQDRARGPPSEEPGLTISTNLPQIAGRNAQGLSRFD